MVQAYEIFARIDDKDFMIIYQPNVDELTLIARDPETENKLKNKVGHILETRRRGNVYRVDPNEYLSNIYKHNLYLTDTELCTLINEARDQIGSTLNYIS